MNDKIYKYLDLKGLESILKEATLKFTKPSDFNDPFEFHDSLVDYEISSSHLIDIITRREGQILNDRLENLLKIHKTDKREFKEALISAFQQRKESTKVSCFSKINDSLLMWAHYGDKHQGACIEFSVNKLLESFVHDFQILEVNYVNDIRAKNISEYRDSAIAHWISTKALDWSYEKEVRLVLGSNPEEFQKFRIQALTHIYLGSKVPNPEKKRIIKLIKKEYKYNWLGISEMSVSTKRFGLEIERLI